jgi:O-antigen/teichoic acid export membrane protein
MEKNNTLKAAAYKTEEARKFAKDIIWVTIAQLFSSFILGIVTLPALTKNYNSEIFGIWSQAFVTVTLLSPIFCLELDMAVVRFLASEEDKTAIRKALGSMLMTIIAVCVIAFITIILLAPQLASLLFGSSEYKTFVPLTFLWVISNALFVFFSAYLRAKKRIRLLSIRSAMLSIIVMAMVIFLAGRGVGLEWIIGFMAAAYGSMTLMFVIMIIREVGWPVLNVTGLKSYLAFSLPQLPSVILLWLMSSSDRYFITHFLGLSQSGIYSSSYQLAAMTRLFFSPIVFVLYPTLSRLWDEEHFAEVKSYLQHSIKLLLTLGIPAAVGIALLSQPLLKLLTTSEFLAGAKLVFLISIGTLFLGINQINGQIILLEKRTKVLPLIIASAAVVSLVMNVVLIPRIGIIGASISNVVSYFVLALVVTIWAGKTIGYRFDFKYVAKVIGATIPMAACIYFMHANSIGGIILSIVAGSMVFILGLYLLRVFSEHDKELIAKILIGFVPNYFKKR